MHQFFYLYDGEDGWDEGGWDFFDETLVGTNEG